MNQLSLDGGPYDPRPLCTISPCELYRYELGELYGDDPVDVWCMCNPSTAKLVAGKVDPDHTIRKVRGFSGSSWVVVNACAFRDRNPKGLLKAADPFGPDNAMYLRKWFGVAHRIIVGWGNALPKPLRADAAALVRSMARDAGRDLWCYGRTKDGQPNHPLTLAYSTPLERWFGATPSATAGSHKGAGRDAS